MHRINDKIIVKFNVYLFYHALWHLKAETNLGNNKISVTTLMKTHFIMYYKAYSVSNFHENLLYPILIKAKVS